MTNKIISLTSHLSGSVEAEDDERCVYERFLFDEGLALLAAYRAIGDRDIRLSVMNLVHNIAAAEQAQEERDTPS